MKIQIRFQRVFDPIVVCIWKKKWSEGGHIAFALSILAFSKRSPFETFVVTIIVIVIGK